MAVKAKDLFELTVDELDEKATSLKKEYFNLRFQKKTGKLEQQVKLKYIRRDIARVLTVRNELILKEKGRVGHDFKR